MSKSTVERYDLKSVPITGNRNKICFTFLKNYVRYTSDCVCAADVSVCGLRVCAADAARCAVSHVADRLMAPVVSLYGPLDDAC